MADLLVYPVKMPLPPVLKGCPPRVFTVSGSALCEKSSSLLPVFFPDLGLFYGVVKEIKKQRLQDGILSCFVSNFKRCDMFITENVEGMKNIEEMQIVSSQSVG